MQLLSETNSSKVINDPTERQVVEALEGLLLFTDDPELSKERFVVLESKTQQGFLNKFLDKGGLFCKL